MDRQINSVSVSTICFHRFPIFYEIFKHLFVHIIHDRILSPEVDAFIRTVTEQNRKSRENVQMQNEDLMQVLINIGNKHSEYCPMTTQTF